LNQGYIPSRPPRSGEKWRAFTDAGGITWEVRELANPDYDRRTGSSLIFESAGTIRRVRNFPSAWVELSETELAELCLKL
jgi:hypothetical protein